ncbi:MAG: alanine--tRNA ligase [Firmicutes bacterium]|nr:alanine--tRNA ligase [Bacillota bacterium]
MQSIGLNELREEYLNFFESKGHLRLPSFSLIPENDPSILLINAGMTPLKPYFTGELKPPRNRVTTCQKCIRTADIERVGKTARHGTYFEMLGNFSFGDYFKKEAISWAWEFVTQVLKMPRERLWVSIYVDDDEAFEIWNKDIGLPAERIVRMGKEDNFWEHGTGPCGPCSEIYFDRGPEKGCGKPDCKVGCDCDRYIEFWNLVFTQFNKEEDGSYTLLQKKNIDTGMGLERLACIMQDVDSLFEVDTIRNILDSVCKVAGTEYGKNYKTDVSIRVITDHIRSITMMISDGILPSNEGRGYVLRRLLRRAARHGKLLGLEKPFLTDLVDIVVMESKGAYPELGEKREYIKKVARVEEEKFNFTIDQGLSILGDYIEDMMKSNEKVIPGELVFKLHDTYGFPLDLTREIAEENGLVIDEEGFEKEMEAQKAKAREALKKKEGSAWGQGLSLKIDRTFESRFCGYEYFNCEAEILYILKNDEPVEMVFEGESATIILNKTSFYAESGGQTGDTGFIETETGLLRVEDCKKTTDGIYLHYGKVVRGYVEKGQRGETRIDVARRESIARNHTATHLIHKALRNILGEHVAQAGSLVEAERLRFDFTHFEPVSEDELKRIEDEVNLKILEDMPVYVEEMGLDEAKNLGAMALFGEKYGERVRVVKIGDYSMELCGGTHMKSTAKIGLVKILSETGIAAGTRRIEAASGHYALKYYREREALLDSIAEALKTTPQDSVKKVENLMAEVKNAYKEIEQLKVKLVMSRIDEIISDALVINGTSVVTAKFSGMDMEALRNTADILKGRFTDGIIILASDYNGKVNFVAAATKNAVKKGIHSGDLIKKTAEIIGGGGGGRPDMAQAGGRDSSRIDEALQQAVEVIKSQLVQ